MVCINPADGKIELAVVFDTYITSDEIEKMISQDIPKGHIVVAACKDDCVKNMSAKVKTWF